MLKMQNFYLFLINKIEYHKKFEEDRGHYTSVADDPETERAKKAMSVQSQVAYTQQSKGAYTKQNNPAMGTGKI